MLKLTLSQSILFWSLYSLLTSWPFLSWIRKLSDWIIIKKNKAHQSLMACKICAPVGVSDCLCSQHCWTSFLKASLLSFFCALSDCKTHYFVLHSKRFGKERGTFNFISKLMYCMLILDPFLNSECKLCVSNLM